MRPGQQLVPPRLGTGVFHGAKLPPLNIVFGGNSLVAGQGGTTMPATFATLLAAVSPTATVTNMGGGAAGNDTPAILSAFSSQIQPLFVSGKRNVYIISEFINHWDQGASNAQSLTTMTSVVATAQSGGWLAYVCTILPLIDSSSGVAPFDYQGRADTLNAGLVSSPLGNGTIDVAADTWFDPTDTSKYADNSPADYRVHLTNLGYDRFGHAVFDRFPLR